MIALLLAVALTCGPYANQMQLDQCAADAQSRADAQEIAALRAAERRTGNDPRFHTSEMRWLDARASACDFAGAMTAGGSIEPMLEAQCNADAATARVRDIGFFTGEANPTAAIPSAQSAAEHERIYGLLELLVTPQQRELLADSEGFFLAYRDAACSYAKDGCATALTRTRTQQLKDAWLAEPFWK
ncbi:MAG: lysozyme inhibitor LprI family protein [Candidatus Aquilonibacter sp.]